jgi:hypothetical protein
MASALSAGVLAASVAIAAAALATARAHAQSDPGPVIRVAATITGEAATQMALPISVGPPDALPRNSFVRLRDLPPAVALSEGHSIGPGVWAVSLAALPNLKMMIPAGHTGRSEFVVMLVGIDGSVLAEARSTLAISAEEGDKTRAAAGEAGPPASASILRAATPRQSPAEEQSAPAKPPAGFLAPLDRERALRLLQKAEEQLQDGAVSPARLLFERAADMGLAEAAMALAATYDATEIARLKLRGVAPDAKEARRWYERARQLGAKGAEEHLRQIGAK